MTWDVVVVGAGPAGSATAARLARGGHRVLLLDRERFPRPKPCGECLSPAAVAELDLLGVLERVRAEPHAELEGWRIGVADVHFEGVFPPGAPGMAMPRDRLDARLVEHAAACGAVVRTGARVTGLLHGPDGASGVRLGGAAGQTERARLVVGADGLRSVVVRRLGLLRRGPRLRKIALTAHLRGVAPMGGRGELRVAPWGCVGLAEVGGGLTNATVVVPVAEGRRLAGGAEEYFDAALRRLELGPAVERVGGVLATGPFDWPTRRAVADGALLVGDAAGYYDPFTGQGIFRALRGARLAAEAADAALRRGDLSRVALAGYDRARRAAFLPGERLQRLIEAVVTRPRLFRVAAERLRVRPLLADSLVGVTGDLYPFRTLLRPALVVQWIV